MQHKAPDTLLRLPQVIGDRKRGVPALVPVSRSTWWQWVAEGKAPAPVRHGRCTFWRSSDLAEFIASAKLAGR